MHGPGDPERARQAAEALADRGVAAVALTYVDNTGITRVKTVPIGRLADAVMAGVGISPVFDVFVVDDSITNSPHIGGPVGDLRLYPDLDALTRLSAQPGWAWAPADRFTQDGQPHVACQRLFAAAMTDRAAERGLELKMAFEIEWFVGRDEGDGTSPACTGPAYGMTRVVELSDYIRELLVVLDDQGVVVEQFHPEYAAGQLELSVAATDPVGAADRVVVVKETIRAVALTHGLRVSFAPVVVAGQVGNGGHLHVSVWSEGRNLFTGGDGIHGLTDRGESLLAGLLDALPALCAVGAPSVASYLRLTPQRWAGPWQCWGLENREAAVRLCAVRGLGPYGANVEVKAIDASANPYLATTVLLAAALDGIRAGATLPEPVDVNPALLSEQDRGAAGVTLLPTDAYDQLERLRRSPVVSDALGEEVIEALLAVRTREHATYAGEKQADVVERLRYAWSAHL